LAGRLAKANFCFPFSVSYLFSGLWHLGAAMAFAVSFGVFAHGDANWYLRDIAFVLPLITCSCAWFFVPDKWAKKGALKFLHYPLPDWDVLLLGPASHRNWLTHSPLLPLLLLGAVWRWPSLAQIPAFGPLVLGACLGIGSHLFWDCVGSARHKIVVVPYWFALREGASRLWLLAGAATCLCIGAAFASVQKLGL
jgi:hypothetical protein